RLRLPRPRGFLGRRRKARPSTASSHPSRGTAAADANLRRRRLQHQVSSRPEIGGFAVAMPHSPAIARYDLKVASRRLRNNLGLDTLDLRVTRPCWGDGVLGCSAHILNVLNKLHRFWRVLLPALVV